MDAPIAPSFPQRAATETSNQVPSTEHNTRPEAPTAQPERTSKERRVADLTIVVPAKNESRTIGEVVAGAVKAMAELEIPGEVLVIDDGSDDGTGARATEHGARVVRHAQSLGNGAAVKRGIREAQHDWILLMDADGQHPAEAIRDLVAKIEEGHDMAIASRGGSGGAWYRNIANRVYNRLASYVTERNIPDLTSGFRLVRADAAKAMVYLLPNTFSYPTTITLSMLRCGYSVEFVPFRVRPRVGKSHIKLLKDGTRFLLIIIKIATFFAPLRVFLPIAMAMFTLGCAWYAYTFLTAHRFTNMSALLVTQASVIFGLGLVSEQVASLRFEKLEEGIRK